MSENKPEYVTNLVKFTDDELAEMAALMVLLAADEATAPATKARALHLSYRIQEEFVGAEEHINKKHPSYVGH